MVCVWLILHILGIVWLENVAEASTTIKKPIYLALVPLLMTLFKVQFANLAVNVFLTAISYITYWYSAFISIYGLSNRCSGVERLLLIEFITVPCWFAMLLFIFSAERMVK